MSYESYQLPNGLRLIHLPSTSPVAYCGFAINAGTRDELGKEYGMAHFVEHLLFKGTAKRKAWHILNRMENVGGELNAYTTKEETLIYAAFLEGDFERAVELLSDLVFHSRFPETEIEKEREVIIDEINSYKDNPSELIFDDFENMLFEGHDIGHHILGEEHTIRTFSRTQCLGFYEKFYHPSNMVFFSMGTIPFQKVIKLLTKYGSSEPGNPSPVISRNPPEKISPQQFKTSKDLHQTHVVIGARSYNAQHPNRTGLFLLNNLLGGPGMNSRLNLSLREKHGLVYTVESGLTSYTDTGIFTIYFGSENKNAEKCLDLVYKELKSICKNKLTDNQLSTAKKQLKGQMGIASDNREQICLSMGKSFLHYNKYEGIRRVYEKIDALNSGQLLEIANEIFDEKHLFSLIYT